MLTKGITMNGKVIPPYSIHHSSKKNADNPNHLRISFRNMPHRISKEEIITSCGLEAFSLEEIVHQQRRLPNWKALLHWSCQGGSHYCESRRGIQS